MKYADDNRITVLTEHLDFFSCLNLAANKIKLRIPLREQGREREGEKKYEGVNAAVSFASRRLPLDFI